MSANAESQTPQQPDSKKGKRKGALLLLTLLFIIIAVAYGFIGFWYCVIMKRPMTLTWQGTRYKSWRRCPAA
jgi:multidrug resistance efflux pump